MEDVPVASLDEHLPPLSPHGSDAPSPHCGTDVGTALSTDTRQPAAHSPVEDLRKQCEQLTADESVQKDAALNIVKLYHGMETLLLHANHERKCENAFLKHELAMTRLAHKNADLVSSVTDDMSRIRSMLQKHDGHIQGLMASLVQLTSSVQDLAARVTAIEAALPVAKSRR